MSTKSHKARVNQLERRAQTGEITFRVFWWNQLEDGTAPIYQDSEGNWRETDTHELTAEPIMIEWPSAPNLMGEDDE